MHARSSSRESLKISGSPITSPKEETYKGSQWGAGGTEKKKRNRGAAKWDSLWEVEHRNGH